jgi:hypothetical protein
VYMRWCVSSRDRRPARRFTLTMPLWSCRHKARVRMLIHSASRGSNKVYRGSMRVPAVVRQQPRPQPRQALHADNAALVLTSESRVRFATSPMFGRMSFGSEDIC